MIVPPAAQASLLSDDDQCKRISEQFDMLVIDRGDAGSRAPTSRTGS
jgi:hypothetical protein